MTEPLIRAVYEAAHSHDHYIDDRRNSTLRWLELWENPRPVIGVCGYATTVSILWGVAMMLGNRFPALILNDVN